MSTGGSAKFLRDKNIKVTDVSDYTNFPEIMDGRVKTINPLVEEEYLGFEINMKRMLKIITSNGLTL